MHFRCKAILFDLDGVLIDSRGCVELVWRAWAVTHGLDADSILRVAHGRRTRETVADIAPHLDIAAEVAILDQMEESETRGEEPIPGVAELVASLPQTQWAVVTSGGPAIAARRLRIAGIPKPSVMITAHDVRHGKPHPEGFLAAAARLGVAASDCLVVEDAPAGIGAARAAGMKVIAVLTTHTSDSLHEANALVPMAGDLLVQSIKGGWLEVIARAG